MRCVFDYYDYFNFNRMRNRWVGAKKNFELDTTNINDDDWSYRIIIITKTPIINSELIGSPLFHIDEYCDELIII